MATPTHQYDAHCKDYPFLSAPLSVAQIEQRREFVASPHLFLEQFCDWLQIAAFVAFVVGSLLNLGYFVFVYPALSDDLFSLMGRLYVVPAIVAALAVLLVQPRFTQKKLAAQMENIEVGEQADALTLLEVTADGSRLKDALQAEPRQLLKGELSELRFARFHELNPDWYSAD